MRSFLRTKCFFRNELIPVIWKPPKIQSNLETFLIQLENKIFKLAFENLRHSKTSKEEWEGIRALADVCTIIIKRAHNKFLCSCVE